MPLLVTRVNRRTTETAIAGEAHVIGEDEANLVFLDEVPLETTGVTIAGFTEIASGSPTAGQFVVDYDGDFSGTVTFNATDNGTAITAAYDGLGSWVYARDFNRIRDKLQGIQTLTDQATIAWDLADQTSAQVTLGGNRTLGAPTNQVAGTTYLLKVIQDGTGSRTLAYNAAFKWPGGTAPTLSTAAGAVDMITFWSDGTNMYGIEQLDFQ